MSGHDSMAAAAAGPEGGLRQVSGAAEGLVPQGETPTDDAIQQVSKEAMGNVDSFHNREATPPRSQGRRAHRRRP